MTNSSFIRHLRGRSAGARGAGGECMRAREHVQYSEESAREGGREERERERENNVYVCTQARHRYECVSNACTPASTHARLHVCARCARARTTNTREFANGRKHMPLSRVESLGFRVDKHTRMCSREEACCSTNEHWSPRVPNGKPLSRAPSISLARSRAQTALALSYRAAI